MKILKIRRNQVMAEIVRALKLALNYRRNGLTACANVYQDHAVFNAKCFLVDGQIGDIYVNLKG